MKIEDGLFEGMTPVKLKGKCADGAEYSYQAFSVSEVLGSVTADSLVEFVSGDGRDNPRGGCIPCAGWRDIPSRDSKGYTPKALV